MNEKNLKSRIIHKHDIEDCWRLAVNFIPKQGEIIVYDRDSKYNYERFKIGDGVTNVNDLPFAVGKVTAEDKTDIVNEVLSNFINAAEVAL